MSTKGHDHKNPEWVGALKGFFAGELSHRAASYLSEQAVIAIHVEEKHFLFQRKNGKNTITEVKSTAVDLADVHFTAPLISLRHLLALAEIPGTGLGTMGVAVIEQLFHADPARKIRLKVNVSFVGLWAKGYFSVLKAGGPEVASNLAKWGFDSLSRIKEMLRKIRG